MDTDYCIIEILKMSACTDSTDKNVEFYYCKVTELVLRLNLFAEWRGIRIKNKSI